MSQQLMNWKKFIIRKLKKSQIIQIIDERKLKIRIIEETVPLFIAIQKHHEQLIFDIVEMIIHNIVLKMSWLKLHNSDVNWKKKIFIFKKCDCVIDIKFMHQQRSMINKKKSFEKFLISIKNDSKMKFISTIIILSQKKQQVKKNKKNYAFSKSLEKKNKRQDQVKKKLKKSLSENIFEKYRKWKHLFQKKLTANALFKHQL